MGPRPQVRDLLLWLLVRSLLPARGALDYKEVTFTRVYVLEI